MSAKELSFYYGLFLTVIVWGQNSFHPLKQVISPKLAVWYKHIGPFAPLHIQNIQSAQLSLVKY